MARVSGSEVQDIIDTDLETLTPFITVASQLVDGISGLGAATLKEIERWLSAHFVAIRDPRIMSEKAGDASANYHGKSAMGLDATPGYNIGTVKPNMPTLQNMINSGVKFNNVWSNPTCTPTRATLLTGKYGFRTGFYF